MKRTVNNLESYGNFSRVTTSHFELEVHNDGRVYIIENANIVRVDIDELRKALNIAEQDLYKGRRDVKDWVLGSDWRVDDVDSFNEQ